MHLPDAVRVVSGTYRQLRWAKVSYAMLFQAFVYALSNRKAAITRDTLDD